MLCSASVDNSSPFCALSYSCCLASTMIVEEREICTLAHHDEQSGTTSLGPSMPSPAVVWTMPIHFFQSAVVSRNVAILSKLSSKTDTIDFYGWCLELACELLCTRNGYFRLFQCRKKAQSMFSNTD